MTMDKRVLQGLEEFLQGDVSNLEMVYSEANLFKVKGTDVERDNAPTILHVLVCANGNASVEMYIHGTMRNIGSFDI